MANSNSRGNTRKQLSAREVTERNTVDFSDAQQEPTPGKCVTFGQLRRRERPSTPEMREVVKRLEDELRSANESRRRELGLTEKVDSQPWWKENERDNQPTDQNTFTCSVSRCGVRVSPHEPEAGAVEEKKFWLAFAPDDLEDSPEAIAEWAKKYGYRPAHFQEYQDFGDWFRNSHPESAKECPIACAYTCKRFDWAMRFIDLNESAILGNRYYDSRSRLLMVAL